MRICVGWAFAALAATSCAAGGDAAQRKLDDGVFFRHTIQLDWRPAPVMPGFEPVGERWYLTTETSR